MKNIILILCCTAVLESCKTTKPAMEPVVTDSSSVIVLDSKPVARPPLDSAWELQSQFGSEVHSENIPQLIINSAEKKFSGSTGCNRMSGTFTFDDRKIKFNEEIITTKMACEGYNENAFINTLLKVNAYNIQDSLLELSQNDIVLLTFKKQ
jgi:heat shock protein HslJ